MTTATSQQRRSFRTLGIRAKILGVGLIGVIGALILGIVSLWGLQSLHTAEEELERLAKVEAGARELYGLVAELDSLQNYIALQSSLEGRQAALGEGSELRTYSSTLWQSVDASVASLRTIEMGEADRASANEAEQLINSYRETDQAMLAAFSRNTAAANTEGLRLVEQVGTPVFHQIRDLKSAWTKHLATEVAETVEAGDNAFTVSRLSILVTILLVVAAVLFAALRISGGILRTVDSVKTALLALGHGDLTVPATADSDDEIGQMAAAAEETRVSMQQVIAQVGQTATSVAAASEELTAVATQVGRDAGDSSSRLGQVSNSAQGVSENIETVAAGTEEMTASIREIASSANAAAGIAAQAVHVADTTNRTVAKLGDSSTEIGNVVKTITSIAEQTNLLALNATIEAARAGEAGKGFAVVANEVKDLAQETGKATEDIGRRVEAIQLDTEAAVQAIAEIATIIAQINDSQATIASAVEEQTATTNEMGRNVSDAATGSRSIAGNVADAARGAQESLQSAQHVSEAASELSQRAADLTGLVGRFRY